MNEISSLSTTDDDLVSLSSCSSLEEEEMIDIANECCLEIQNIANESAEFMTKGKKFTIKEKMIYFNEKFNELEKQKQILRDMILRLSNHRNIKIYLTYLNVQ